MGKRYEFGEFILDTQEGLLLRSNEPVKATPRLLALLESLVDRRGRLVEKKEILDRVWEGTSVGEANLTVQMSKLRRLLGETEALPFIETVPTRGYRFLVPVRVLPPAATAALPLRFPAPELEVDPDEVLPPAAPSPPSATTPVDRRPFRWWPWGLAAVLAALVAWMVSGGDVRRLFGRPSTAPDAGAAATTTVSTAPDGTLRLTSNVADDWEPAVSPDGRTVAFVSNRDGVPAIYLLALERRDEHPVRVRTRGPASAPSWSPDGARLAFVCQRNGQADICLVGRDGSDERVVVAEPQDEFDPVWSQDGRQLAYNLVSGRTWELRVVDVAGAGPEGAQPRRVGPAGWSARTPAWSPDGRRLAVSRWRSADDYDIWIVPLDGSEPTPVVESAEGKLDPAWSPDGRRLAYATDHGLAVVDVETKAATSVASTDRQDRRPSWSSDGRSLVVERGRDGNSEIYRVPVR